MAQLYTNFAEEKQDLNKVTLSERTIATYIERYGDVSYDGLISEETDWNVFYQLSELRTGLISWYDFKPGATVLEVGAGFGALTGRLCRMCNRVTATERSLYRAQALAKRYVSLDNLEIYAGDLKDMSFPEAFDYIVVAGLLERVGGDNGTSTPYVEYLQLLQKYLKPRGKVLLAVENRFGLRYFCGAVEPHTNRAFDGINGYTQGTRGRSFGREELSGIIREAGFGMYKFYYPLPDYKLPQLIYTDGYLPERNLKERLIPYYRRNDTLVASELELYDEIVANGVFPFFANSFFVECATEAVCEMGQVEYAAVSTDRGEERSFVTAVMADKTVRKCPLYEDGKAKARQLYDNIEDLRAHGIPAVPHRLCEDGSLEMPFVPLPTLSNEIKRIIREDAAAFEGLMDRVWDMILRSSEQVAQEQVKRLNALPGVDPEDPDFGPLLKRAYMELIPLNCFYNPGTDELLYFDQEFVRENYPAKYVLFRAIHYVYCFTPNAEQYYPLEKMKQRYGLSTAWEGYLAEEARFLDEVRNHERYRQFYCWAQIDPVRIRENAQRLESEEEKIANYRVSHKMKQVWKVELEMLDAVDAICKKHNLTYFLVHGSLLGAVRHKGFIPWDDDLDIAMPGKDYDAFLELAPKELPAHLSVHTPATEEIFWGGFARIRNSRTTGIEVMNLGHKGNMGIWIDILPVDVCTSDEKRLARKQKYIKRYHRLLAAKSYGGELKQWRDLKPLQWKLYRLWAAFISRKRLGGRLEEARRLYTDEASGEVAFFSGYEKHRRLSAADFEETVLLEFMHRKVPVPVGYEQYLFAILGKDYMKYPPEEERKPKHRGIMDPERPYEVYTKMLCDTFAAAKGKKIILFGAGLMFEDYMKKYSDKYRPAFIVDNDENKWGRSRMGIEIRKPEEILEVPVEKRHLIICSFYYREISAQLENMGITDYKVYVQEPEWILQTEERQE